MSDETPSVEEIKSRLKIEVEEEPVKGADGADISNQLKNLGRQFAETLQSAWNSEERQRIESEVREGVKSFVGEVDRVFQDASSSAAAERIRNEAASVKNKVDSSDLGKKAQSSLAQGLKWMSEELNKLADKFTSPEKSDSEA